MNYECYCSISLTVTHPPQQGACLITPVLLLDCCIVPRSSGTVLLVLYTCYVMIIKNRRKFMQIVEVLLMLVVHIVQCFCSLV